MTPVELLRTAGPPALAALAALAVDRLAARKGFDPPGFVNPWRRLGGMTAIAAVLWAGVFSPLGLAGQDLQPDYGAISTPQLFALHLLFLAALAIWYGCGFFGLRSHEFGAPRTFWGAQFGLRTERPWRELGLGLLAGIAAWAILIAALVGIAMLISAFLGEKWLQRSPAAMIVWIAGLPTAVKVLLSLSAGIVEEGFFRGFLQPRIGILLSTLLFVLAHVVYEQPFMLMGIALLSLLYGLLVRWRQNILPAMAAHVLFDCVQLLVVVPAILRLVGTESWAAPVANIFGLIW